MTWLAKVKGHSRLSRCRRHPHHCWASKSISWLWKKMYLEDRILAALTALDYRFLLNLNTFWLVTFSFWFLPYLFILSCDLITNDVTFCKIWSELLVSLNGMSVIISDGTTPGHAQSSSQMTLLKSLHPGCRRGWASDICIFFFAKSIHWMTTGLPCDLQIPACLDINRRCWWLLLNLLSSS